MLLSFFYFVPGFYFVLLVFWEVTKEFRVDKNRVSGRKIEGFWQVTKEFSVGNKRFLVGNKRVSDI